MLALGCGMSHDACASGVYTCCPTNRLALRLQTLSLSTDSWQDGRGGLQANFLGFRGAGKTSNGSWTMVPLTYLSLGPQVTQITMFIADHPVLLMARNHEREQRTS